MRRIIKRKTIVVILGFLFCVVLLEIGLRISGFVFASLQDRRNITALKQKGAYHIMCLGESTTADGGAFSWPSQLEGILNRSNIGVKFSVINKGVSDLNTSYIVEHLEENLHKCAPDMVITMIGITDGYVGDVRVHEDFPIETYKLIRLLRNNTMKNIKDKIRKMKIYKQERMLKKAIELNPGNDLAYFELGNCYREQGKDNKAEEILKKAIEQNLGKDMAYYALGCCYRDQEKYDKAEAMFEKAIELNPTNDRAYFELGSYYMGQGKYGKAEEMLKKAIEFNAGDDRANFELGCYYRKQGEYEKAKEMFKKAIELRYRQDMIHFKLGPGYIEQTKPGKVGAISKDAITPNPGGKDVCMDININYFALERCYREQGKYDEAEAILKKLLERSPSDDNAYSELALLYETMGKNKSAQEYRKKAEEIRLQKSLLVTRHNYQELKRILGKRGIKLVCVQYPMRSVELLKKTLDPYKDVVFVDNEKLFKDAIKQGDYDEYFVDVNCIDFGHCTPKGNRLLATNIANIVLSEYFK